MNKTTLPRKIAGAALLAAALTALLLWLTAPSGAGRNGPADLGGFGPSQAQPDAVR